MPIAFGLLSAAQHSSANDAGTYTHETPNHFYSKFNFLQLVGLNGLAEAALGSVRTHFVWLPSVNCSTWNMYFSLILRCPFVLPALSWSRRLVFHRNKWMTILHEVYYWCYPHWLLRLFPSHSKCIYSFDAMFFFYINRVENLLFFSLVPSHRIEHSFNPPSQYAVIDYNMRTCCCTRDAFVFRVFISIAAVVACTFVFIAWITTKMKISKVQSEQLCVHNVRRSVGHVELYIYPHNDCLGMRVLFSPIHLHLSRDTVNLLIMHSSDIYVSRYLKWPCNPFNGRSEISTSLTTRRKGQEFSHWVFFSAKQKALDQINKKTGRQ